MAIAEKETRKEAGKKKARIGRVDQIIGPVVDVAFETDELPEIYHALEIDRARVKEGLPSKDLPVLAGEHVHDWRFQLEHEVSHSERRASEESALGNCR